MPDVTKPKPIKKVFVGESDDAYLDGVCDFTLGGSVWKWNGSSFVAYQTGQFSSGGQTIDLVTLGDETVVDSIS